MRMKRTRLALLVLGGLAILASPFLVAHLFWRAQAWRTARIQLIDYSVPFVSAREHRGAVWLLNYEKYRAPAEPHWELLHSYAGYDPTDREHFRPISSVDLSATDWVFVADAYGVYKNDLRDIAHEEAHMDFNQRIVGGLSAADAAALAAHVARGRHLFLEFNSMEEPTTPEVRATVEALVGVHWTGWTGRTFPDLRDTTDVPWWLPRLYKEQYGDGPLPYGPTLALVHRSGKMLLVSGFLTYDVAPAITVTELGAEQIPLATGRTDYHYWFPVLEAAPGTEVLAELAFKPGRDIDSVRAIAAIPARIPMLTRTVVDGSHRVYLAADLSDVDFDPGAYAFAGLARLHAGIPADPRIYNSSRAFWEFYVPAVSKLLRAPYEAAALPAAPPATR